MSALAILALVLVLAAVLSANVTRDLGVALRAANIEPEGY